MKLYLYCITVVDFSISYYETSAGFLAHYPRELSKRAALLRPYKTAVWVGLSILIILSGPLGYWISRSSRKSKGVKLQLSVLQSYEICYQLTLCQGKIWLQTSNCGGLCRVG